MIRINLLPYREIRREAHRRRFRLLLILAALLAGLLLSVTYTLLDAKVNDQLARNARLEGAINTLNGTLRNTASLHQERQALMERQQLVERLQAGRNDAVRLLDQLASLTPPGIYLKEVRPSADNQRITLAGMARSGERVSTYLTLLGGDTLFSDPQLNYVRDPADPTVRGSEFSVTVKIGAGSVQPAAAPGVAP